MRISIQKAKPMTPLEIAGLVASFLMALGGLISSLSNRKSARVSDKKTEAEAEKTHVEAQSSIIKDLCSEVDRLVERLDELEQENKVILKTNADLEERVEQLEKDNDVLQRQYRHVLEWAEPRGYQPPSNL